MVRSFEEKLLYRNVKRFRAGLIFKAHRLLYHSALGLRVIKKKKKCRGKRARRKTFRVQTVVFGIQGSGFRVQGSGFRVPVSGFRVQGSGLKARMWDCFAMGGTHSRRGLSRR